MPIYVGNTKIDPSGIEKVYVGSQLVYQKQTAQWHTVWSGSQNFGAYWTSSSGVKFGNSAIVSSSDLRAGVLTKITFTKQNIHSSSRFTKEGTSSSSITVTSPVEFTSAALGQDLLYGKLVLNQKTSCYFNFSVYTGGNGSMGIWIGTVSGSNTNYICSMTITKIEQYY